MRRRMDPPPQLESYAKVTQELCANVTVPHFELHKDTMCGTCFIEVQEGACPRCGGKDQHRNVVWVECDVAGQIEAQLKEHAASWLDHAMPYNIQAKEARALDDKFLEVFDGSKWSEHRDKKFGLRPDPRHLSLAVTCDGFGFHRTSLFAFSLEILNVERSNRGHHHEKILFAMVQGHVGNCQHFFEHLRTQLSPLTEIGITVEWPDISRNGELGISSGSFNLRVALAVTEADMPAQADSMGTQRPTGLRGCRFGCVGIGTRRKLAPTQDSVPMLSKSVILEHLQDTFEEPIDEVQHLSGLQKKFASMRLQQLLLSNDKDRLNSARQRLGLVSVPSATVGGLRQQVLDGLFASGIGAFAGVHFDNIAPVDFDKEVRSTAQWKSDIDSLKAGTPASISDLNDWTQQTGIKYASPLVDMMHDVVAICMT